MILLKTFFSRKWLLPSLFVIISMLTMIRLGIWQLDRLQERRQANAVLMQTLQTEPLTLTADMALPDEIASLKDRAVVATGQFDLEQQVVLLVQSWNGRAGVHLITPFLLDEQTAVIVNRGWVPQADYEDGNLAQYDLVGPTQLDGYVVLSQPFSRYGDAEAQPTGPQTELYRIDVDQLQEQLPYRLLPFVVWQNPAANQSPPFRTAVEIDLSEGPHLSYSIQWFFFTTILGIGYALYVNNTLKQPPPS